MAGMGWNVGVSVSVLAARRHVGLTPGRRLLALLVIVVPAAAFALWSSSGVAHACDPVTGEGCDTVPPSSAPTTSTAESPAPETAPPQTAPPQTAPPQTAPPQTAPPRGGPVVPTTQPAPAPTTAAPAAPPTTLAPPTTAADEPSTKSDSGGGGVPWQLAAAVPAVLLAGAVGTGAVIVAKKKSDPLAAYTNTCNDLCWLKQQEAQADADVQAIQAQQAQVEEAWRQAREYLRNQLRADYIAHKQNRALATVGLAASTPLSALVSGVGFSLSIAMHGTRSQWYGYFDPRHWNKQVNDELISAQGLIDGIRNEKQLGLGNKLVSAKLQQEAATGARQNAESKLVSLRAQNPDVTFPPCGCE
jgi:hypothetical protein